LEISNEAILGKAILGTMVQGHQSQMAKSIKLFKNEKLTFIKKQKCPHVGDSLTFVNP